MRRCGPVHPEGRSGGAHRSPPWVPPHRSIGVTPDGGHRGSPRRSTHERLHLNSALDSLVAAPSDLFTGSSSDPPTRSRPSAPGSHSPPDLAGRRSRRGAARWIGDGDGFECHHWALWDTRCPVHRLREPADNAALLPCLNPARRDRTDRVGAAQATCAEVNPCPPTYPASDVNDIRRRPDCGRRAERGGMATTLATGDLGLGSACWIEPATAHGDDETPGSAADSAAHQGLRFWHPQRDSNPCRHLERVAIRAGSHPVGTGGEVVLAQVRAYETSALEDPSADRLGTTWAQPLDLVNIGAGRGGRSPEGARTALVVRLGYGSAARPTG